MDDYFRKTGQKGATARGRPEGSRHILAGFDRGAIGGHLPHAAAPRDQQRPFKSTGLDDGGTVWMRCGPAGSPALPVWRGIVEMHVDLPVRAYGRISI
jgi:hypothetical protein